MIKIHATPLLPADRSIERLNCPHGSCPHDRLSSVRQAVVSLVRWRRRNAADDHWRTMNIHRLDNTLWLAASMPMRAARLVQALQDLFNCYCSCASQRHTKPIRGVYLYLPMATNAPWSFGGGAGSIKSLILSFNIQKCEFCAQI